MKTLSYIIPLLLLLSLTVSCVQPPAEMPEAETQAIGFYPAGDGRYCILALKSVRSDDTYDYEDSLMFVHIDTAGNVRETYAYPFEYRPNIDLLSHLPNGNVLLYGDLGTLYYMRSLWKMSLQGELLRDWNIGDYVTGMIPSQNGNIFLFGNNYDEETDRLSCLKLTPAGDTLWHKLFPKRRDEYIRGGIPLSDHGFLALGTARGEYWSTDMLAVRFNASGDTLWTRTYGGDRYDRVHFAEELSDGSLLLAGELNVTDTSNTDWSLNSGQQVYLVKISADGETQWTRAVGNTLRESPNALAECSDGNYIYAATRSESYVYLFDETQGLLCKTDTDGEVLWQAEFNSRVPAGLQELESGEFLVAATELVESYQYGSTLHVIKLSASGTLLSDTALIP